MKKCNHHKCDEKATHKVTCLLNLMGEDMLYYCDIHTKIYSSNEIFIIEQFSKVNK